MTLIAMSASYGAGGSRIAPAVAERLGVPFVDRAIPMAVAARLQVPVEDAAAHEDRAGGWLARILRGFVGTDAGVPAPLPPDAFSSQDFRRATEEVIRRQAATGEGVILGRGAVIVLRDDDRVLRVRLDGPAERRLEQAVALSGIDRDEAERAMRQLDRAHDAYTKDLYGVDLRDYSLYHLVLDATAIPIEDCVEMIVMAARSLAHPRVGAK